MFVTAHSLFAQWTQMSGPDNWTVNTFTLFPNGLGGTNFFAATESGVFGTTDTGASWTSMSNGLTSSYVYALTYSLDGAGTDSAGRHLFAGLYGGVFHSTNHGTHWTAASSGLQSSNTTVYALCAAPNGSGGTNLFAGTADYLSVYISTDNGTNWSAASNGLVAQTGVMSFLVSHDGSTIFVGTFDGVYRSTDNGTNWVSANGGLTNPDITSFVFLGKILFAGDDSKGVFRSTDNGAHWASANAGLANPDVSALAADSSGNLFAGIVGGGVFLSIDSGSTWNAMNDGLTNLNVVDLAVSETYLFAGSYQGGVWRRPLSEMVTGVQAQEDGIPLQFALGQNYPNPFNPTTTITYTIPTSSSVSIKLLDLMGGEVAVLLSEQLPPGTYSQEWNAAGMASGVYFCRLLASPSTTGESGTFTQIRKLMLMK
jgi:photosystem II stability/assembly factor-like uncharacterized protein